MKPSRRGFAFGAMALAVLGIAGLNYRRLLGPWYAPTPYDDLLHQIVDRRPAKLLGQAVRNTRPGPISVEKMAAALRRPGFALERRARTDAAAGRVVEVSGWIIPEAVAAYSLLAAQFA